MMYKEKRIDTDSQFYPFNWLLACVPPTTFSNAFYYFLGKNILDQ